MEKIVFNAREILESLERSGYLFESEISKFLIEENYYVETNKVIKDNFTGKSREIDLIAELFDNNSEHRNTKCFNRVQFIFEIKNTSAPLVLLTEFQNSEYAKDWEAVKEIMKMKDDEDFFSNLYWQKIALEKRYSIFTQYCSFQKKNRNDELMALHPDNIYTGLSKICQYCEEELNRLNILQVSDDYLRNYIFVPILLISEDLYELNFLDDKKPTLTKSECSLLLYNYHYGDSPKMAYVFVVTKSGLPDLLKSINQIKSEVIENMMHQKNKSVT